MFTGEHSPSGDSSDPQHASLLELLKRASECDKAAVAELYVHLYDRMFRVARRIVPNDAEDVVHNAWVSMLGKLDASRFESDKHVEANACLVVQRRAIEHLRRKRTPNADDPEVAAPEHADYDVPDERVERMRLVLQKLDQTERQFVELRITQSLSFKDCVPHLGGSTRKLWSKWHHLCDKIKYLLRELDGEPP